MTDNKRTPGEENPLLPLAFQMREYILRPMMVCLPGKVVSFNSSTQMAQVECGIQQYNSINDSYQTIPVISNVRVNFAGDGSWYMWHQVGAGTEGLIHFSQRAIDTWLDRGGPTAPHELRMFSAEDAFFVPGIRSTPNAIPSFVNDGVGLSSYDGGTRIHMTDGQIVMTAGGSTMTLNASGLNVESTAMTHNGTNVGDTHQHPQGDDSDGNSEQDTGGPF